ncbi:hypothetical protein VTL71DRAFT_4330 [Oculimacula yallundae]|uniref:Uncharacterized protein n=1 Tax=Oculimacula yallundae TaxID=86028 RepID=A0ABR4C1N3_9HELO
MDMTTCLQDLAPTFRKICSKYSVTGMSIRTLHHDNIIYEEGFCFRNVEAKLRSVSDTVYSLGSTTKDLWEGFDVVEATINNHTTMIDQLGHRTGLERADAAMPYGFNLTY